MIEAMKQALEHMEWSTPQGKEAYLGLVRAIAEAEQQESVAWMHDLVSSDGDTDYALSFAPDNFPLQEFGGFKSVRVSPLYTHPPKREWVGLTDEEMQAIYFQFSDREKYGYGRMIEAKLKEKNNAT